MFMSETDDNLPNVMMCIKSNQSDETEMNIVVGDTRPETHVMNFGHIRDTLGEVWHH